jgi:hypothetical protein
MASVGQIQAGGGRRLKGNFGWESSVLHVMGKVGMLEQFCRRGGNLLVWGPEQFDASEKKLKR